MNQMEVNDLQQLILTKEEQVEVNDLQKLVLT